MDDDYNESNLEDPPQDKIKVLFKGRRYNWQAKVNLHLHIIEHELGQCVEIIGYDTSTSMESSHIFIPIPVIYKYLNNENKLSVSEVVERYQRNGISIPDHHLIEESIRSYEISSFLLEKMVVSTNPFSIDIKHTSKSSKGLNLKTRLSQQIKKIRSIQKSNNKQEDGNEEFEDSSENESSDNSIKSPERKDSKKNSSFSFIRPIQNTLSFPKPTIVNATKVKRFGRSTTLVGEVPGEKISKEEEVLAQMIISIKSPSAPTRERTLLNKLSISNKKKKKTKKKLVSFYKFKNDNDLLLEALSFIHISDFFILRCVCKKWNKVLSYGTKILSKVYISSRDYYNKEIIDSNSKSLEEDDALDENDLEFKKQLEEIKISDSFKLRKYFVLSATVQKVVKSCYRFLSSLTLHYVILDQNAIKSFRVLSDRINHLCIGIVKFDDSTSASSGESESESNDEAENSSLTKRRPSKFRQPNVNSFHKTYSFSPRPPSVPNRGNQIGLNNTFSPRKNSIRRASVLGSTNESTRSSPTRDRKYSELANAHKSQSHSPNQKGELLSSSVNTEVKNLSFNEQDTGKTNEEIPKESKGQNITRLRLINGNDIKSILKSCGEAITHLELNVSVGPLPPDAFMYTPNLEVVTAIDSLIAPEIKNKNGEFVGEINMNRLVKSFEGISIPELLIIMEESLHEAMMLTDKRGKICVVNKAFEQLFGYNCSDINGHSIDFLRGPSTDSAEFEKILLSVKAQGSPFETVLFLYNSSKNAFLCQVIFVPNISRHQGAKLNEDSLSPDFLEILAVEYEEIMKKKSQAQKESKNWLFSQNEYSYHFFRFGCLSSHFTPKQNASQS